jgi:hypothetical protein
MSELVSPRMTKWSAEERQLLAALLREEGIDWRRTPIVPRGLHWRQARCPSLSSACGS